MADNYLPNPTKRTPHKKGITTLNLSQSFRMAVALHFAILCVLTFEMKNTLFGLWHYIVAVGLTVLMGAIVALFVADMATPGQCRVSRAIDATIGIGWAAVVGFLVSNSWHSRTWISN